ncbi:hyaluronoglucosaminidase [Selenomonas sp. GACV-9]|uniref:protein O-GlcNAcase n=1 Tax=Selenomonas sp. GACV-9 TaxID=3158782 RepID=UPI0008EA2C67|nr:hyaluronoglucosaminidase [Selenomonas ruminantium]
MRLFPRALSLRKAAIVLAGGLVFSSVLGNSSVIEATPIPLRGIIEGFYGTPWQQAERLDILAFCHTQDLNAYIYAPKDDPYHRAKWREPYPAAKMQELSALIKAAKAQNVRFIFAVSPGLDIHFSGLKSYQDRLAMERKLQAMYDLGVRDFAIFFDDIQDKDGKGQAKLLNWISEHFVAAHKDVNPLLTVPTEYFYKDMQVDGELKPYTRDFSTTLNPEIQVLYTGDGVVPDGLSDAQLQAADNLYGRALGIWWNYPVTDYMESKLALGPIEKLPTKTSIPAIFFNPMKHEQLSKIALATGADYARAPQLYQTQAAWEKAIAQQYGNLASDMKRVAAESQHLENNWAKIGPADGQELRQYIDAYWQSSDGASTQQLTEHLTALKKSAASLKQNLPAKTLSECQPQIEQLIRIVDADLTGMRLREQPDDKTLKEQFIRQRQDVIAHDEKAKIAETSARAFLNELASSLTIQ